MYVISSNACIKGPASQSSQRFVVKTIFRSFYRMYHHVCGLGTYLGDRTPLWDMSHRTISHIQLWPLWGYTHLHSWFLWEDPESWIGLTVRWGREEHAVSVLTGQCWQWASATWTTRTLRCTAWRVFTLSSREWFPVSNPDPFPHLGDPPLQTLHLGHSEGS